MPTDPAVIDIDWMPRGGPDASWLDRRPQTDRAEYLDRDEVDDRIKRVNEASADEIVARAGMFQGVELSAVSALTKQLQPVDFPRGHTVFAEGEPGDRLFIIISGEGKSVLISDSERLARRAR